LPQSVSAIAFAAVILVAFACWLFSVAEALGMWRFWSWAYRAGPRVLERALPKPACAFPGDAFWCTADIKAKAVDAQHILFRCPMPVFAFRIHTPFPILGTATVESDVVRVIARIPLGPTGFLVAWALGWTIGGVAAGATSPLTGLGVAALGWALAAGFAAFSISLELVRFRRAQDALALLLAVPPPNNRWRGP
jgi:hypothetical protein